MTNTPSPEIVTQPTSAAGLAGPSGSAKRRSTQCQCCASPLGEPIRTQGTERIICAQCLGFIARWWIEIGEVERNLGVTYQPGEVVSGSGLRCTRTPDGPGVTAGETAPLPNGEVRHSAGKTECDQKEKDQ